VAAKKDIKSFSHVCRAKNLRAKAKSQTDKAVSVSMRLFFCMCVFGFCIYVLRQIIVIWLIQKLQLLWGVVVFASSHELEKVFRFSLPGIFR